MPFDGLGRIGELSGQISAEQWKDILGSADELKKKNPDLAKNAAEAMELIRERSLSFEDLEESEHIDEALIGRVMERFERSRLSTGARVSVPYLLLDSHPSVTEKIMKVVLIALGDYLVASTKNKLDDIAWKQVKKALNK